MTPKFIKDTFTILLSRGIQILLGLLNSILIARYFGPEGRGIYILAMMLPSILILLTDVGIGSATVFYSAKKAYSLKELLGANILFSILISSIAAILGILSIIFLKNTIFKGLSTAHLFLALMQLPFGIGTSFLISILIGLNKIKLYSICRVSTTLALFLSLLIILIFKKNSIELLIASQSLAYLIGFLLTLYFSKIEAGGIIFTYNSNLYNKLIIYGLKNYFNNVFSYIQYKMDILVINIYLDPLKVGLYSLAVSLTEQIWVISDSVSTLVFPRTASEKDENQLKNFTPLVMRNLIFIVSLISVFLFIIGDNLIITLFSYRFFASIEPFKVLLFGVIMISGWRILASDLYGRGMPHINSLVVVIVTIFNILLYFLLIPKYGINGAAWATVITYTLAFISGSIIYCKISKNKIIDLLIIKKTDILIYQTLLKNFIERYIKRKI